MRILLFFLLVCSSVMGQKIQFDYCSAYKYRKDMLRGVKTQWQRNTIALKNNKVLKRVLSTNSYQFSTFGNDEPFEMDSSVIPNKKFKTNQFDFYVFSKMMDNITSNENNKFIGLQPYYFLTQESLLEMDEQQISDSLNTIKKELKKEMGNIFYSSVWERFWVELEYNNVQYTITKTEHSPFWKVYINGNEEPSFKFIYPDWNLFVGQVFRKKGKDILPSLRYLSRTYDLGNEMKTPITPKRKRAKIQN